jgi:Shikimate 5-dehydrogenase
MTHISGVLGRDISYSLSPKIHKLFAEAAGIHLNYEIYHVEHDPVSFIYNFFKEGGLGLDITNPYQ